MRLVHAYLEYRGLRQFGLWWCHCGRWMNFAVKKTRFWLYWLFYLLLRFDVFELQRFCTLRSWYFLNSLSICKSSSWSISIRDIRKEAREAETWNRLETARVHVCPLLLVLLHWSTLRDPNDDEEAEVTGEILISAHSEAADEAANKGLLCAMGQPDNSEVNQIEHYLWPGDYGISSLELQHYELAIQIWLGNLRHRVWG